MTAMQQKIKTLILCLGLSAGLSACTSVPEEPPQPQAIESRSYHEILESAYARLAQKAFDEMDWVDAYRFQNKAALARDGRIIEPDNPSSRSIAVARDPDILEAYKVLRSYLQGDGLAKAPADVALAQAAYDCWIENAEESEAELSSGQCRSQYEQALRRIEDSYIESAMGNIEAKPGARE